MAVSEGIKLSPAKTAEDLKPPNKLVNRRLKHINDDHRAQVRIRRTQSVTKVEKIVEVDRKVRRQQSDKPCHITRDSLFSMSSGFNNFEGFVNWGAFILMLGGLRLFLENMLKYGLQVSFANVGKWLARENQDDSYFHTPLFLCFSNLHVIYAFILEKQMLRGVISDKTGVRLHIIHLITIICIPPLVFTWYADQFSLLGRCIITNLHVVALLKLWSYAQVNHWCRMDLERAKKNFRRRSYSFKKSTATEDINSSDDNQPKMNGHMYDHESYQPIEYPHNLYLGDLYYFLVAPTLCYELNFPRSRNIRYGFLLRRLAEAFILSNILVGLFQQWIIPSVTNSLKPFSEMDYAKSTERVLKLAIPTHLMWLLWFYLMFHSFLNTVGELLKFGDRNFYQDWWNSKDVGTFWRLWNMPIHTWCVRHVFVPLLSLKYPKWFVSVVVFLFSAFFHEYSVSVPLRMYKVGVFMGMWMQVPLVYLSQYVSHQYGPRLGNLMVWSSLILGQPIGIMVYCHDYMIQNYGSILFKEYVAV